MTSSNHHRAAGRTIKVGIDVSDLDSGGAFWGGVLGLTPSAPRGQYITVGNLSDGVSLFLQRVPEEKSIKNRVHLDLEVDDLDESVARVLELGGSLIEELVDGSYRFTVMADPDGNEFCLLPK